MKKIIFVLAISFSFLTQSYANSSEIKENDYQTIKKTEIAQQGSIDAASVIIKSLELKKINEYECTLSVELSYNGVKTTLSITEDTCEKAGAGVAQAVKGFLEEINGEN
ncbi:hypothetical protein GWK08_05850 [Leptobacterium flavescens]|uniref:DUF3568 family protein n=1 Tax=Leptobacterium flavescens TaxID=472055 RepID=A0A6P0UPY4_9FLAO|nr:hypothetical protein [Leptobacterium flavescens]NER12953.1 hypothetical protein [Leptobacterium flavescens]